MSVIGVLFTAALSALVGFALMALALRWLNTYLPFDIHREIVEEKNMAVATLVGAMLLGLAAIFAASIFLRL